MSDFDKDAELRRLQDEAKDWIEDLTGEDFPSDDWVESLKDGVLLCMCVAVHRLALPASCVLLFFTCFVRHLLVAVG